jgi:hypothetical protein
MRTIVRGSNPEKVKSRVKELTKRGWKQISDIKVDPTPTIEISYVTVMEKPDNKPDDKKRKWNSYVSYH